MLFHVGDIKNGSTRCDDATYNWFKGVVGTFAGPVLLTPGDNEWTDCHRANNGAYNPLERLAYERSVLFAQSGRTLGAKPIMADTDAAAGFPENQRLRVQGLDIALLHIVGSNDDLQPWMGLGKTAATPEQVAEEKARMADALASMGTTFATARHKHDRAVVLMLQADMFDPTYTPKWTDISAFQPFVQALVKEANAFDGPVYLINGDSHVYTVDRPLAAGSAWLTTYGVSGSADNLTRITVDGSDHNVDWLKVTVTKPGSDDVLSWERVPYRTPAQ